MEEKQNVVVEKNGKVALRNVGIGTALLFAVSPAFALDATAAASTITGGSSTTDVVLLALITLAASIYIGKKVVALVGR